MNPNDARQAWTRLTSVARRATDDRDDSAPFGFATRVVAQAMAQDRRVASLFDRFALRALGVACLLAVSSVALNYSAAKSSSGTDEVANADDPVAILLDS
jgi:hypothetical protein